MTYQPAMTSHAAGISHAAMCYHAAMSCEAAMSYRAAMTCQAPMTCQPHTMHSQAPSLCRNSNIANFNFVEILSSKFGGGLIFENVYQCRHG